MSAEESAKDRLNDIFAIESLEQCRMDVVARKSHESTGETFKQLAKSVVIALVKKFPDYTKLMDAILRRPRKLLEAGLATEAFVRDYISGYVQWFYF